jgi:diaminopropionate ammonia-lyase family
MVVRLFRTCTRTIFTNARMTDRQKSIYVNPGARKWKYDGEIDTRIKEFHQRMPGFSPTPLISIDSVAKELGVKHVFVKDESSRAGLPAFKILGASWASYRAMADATYSSIGVPLEEISEAARKQGIKLFAATDGNHGRAVARVAKISGLDCDIFVPSNLDRPTQDLIASEGCRVVVVDGNYDYTVQEARVKSDVPNGLLIQDTAFEGYTEIAQVSLKSSWKSITYSHFVVDRRRIFDNDGGG